MEGKFDTGASEIQVTELQNDDDVKNKSGEFIQNWGKFKGHLKSRRVTTISVGQEKVTEKDEKEETKREKVETDFSENPDKMTKNQSVDFIQNWGRLKGRMKTREPSNLSLYQEEKSKTMETNEEVVKERIETKTADRRQQNNLNVQQGEKSQISKKEEVLEEKIEASHENKDNRGIIQDWGNLKGRMKSKGPINVNPVQGKKSQIKKNKNEEAGEEKMQAGETDLEIMEMKAAPQNDGFIQDWGNLQRRVKTTANEKECSSLFKEIKELESRLRNNSNKKL